MNASIDVELFFDSAPDAIFIHTLEGEFLAVNQTACRRLGYRREELLQMQVCVIDDPAQAEFFPQRIAALQANGEARFESIHRTRTGDAIPVEVHCRRIQHNGQPAILSIARDISKRSALRQSLLEQAEIQSSLSDLSTSLVMARGTELDAVIQRGMAMLAKLLGADRSYLYLISWKSGCMNCAYEWHREDLEPLKVKFASVPMSPFAWLLSQMGTGELVAVEECDDLPEEAVGERALLHALEVQSCYFQPMFNDHGHLMGGLGVIYHLPMKTLSPRSQGYLKLVAEIIGRCINKHQYEQELRKSRDQFRSLIQHIPGFAYRCVANEARTMGYLSEGFQALTGFDPTGFVANQRRPFRELISPEDLPDVEIAIANAIAADRPWEVQYRLRCASGEQIWVHEGGAAVRLASGCVDFLEGFICRKQIVF